MAQFDQVNARLVLVHGVENDLLANDGIGLDLVSQSIRATDARPSTYVAILVHVVVGQFRLLEANHLFSQLLSCKGRIWVQIEPDGRGLVCLAGYQPGRAMVGVSIALIVNWHNVHQHCVPCVWVGIVK